MANGYYVEGYVYDEYGEPMVGFPILVTGTSIGTTTDIEGYYMLSMPAAQWSSGTITAYMAGYVEQVISINGRNVIDIYLEVDDGEEKITYSVNGYVTDENGNAIVNVSVTSGNVTVRTDQSGYYSINEISEYTYLNTTLKFYKVGYETQYVSYSGSTINVTLYEQTTSLRISTVSSIVSKFGSNFTISGLNTLQCVRRSLIPEGLYCPYFYQDNQLVPIDFIASAVWVAAKITNIVINEAEIASASILVDGEPVDSFYFKPIGNNLLIVAPKLRWAQISVSSSNTVLQLGTRSSVASSVMNDTIRQATITNTADLTEDILVEFEWPLADETILTMTVTDWKIFSSENNIFVDEYCTLGDAFNYNECDGNLYPESKLYCFDTEPVDGTDNVITGTLSQWLNLYNHLYDPESEKNGAVLLVWPETVLEINEDSFYKAIKKMTTQFIDCEVEFCEYLTMTVTDWGTFASNSGWTSDKTYYFQTTGGDNLNTSDYPQSHLYYDGSYSEGVDNIIVGTRTQWTNLDDAFYPGGEVILIDSYGHDMSNVNCDNLHTAIETMVTDNINSVVSFIIPEEPEIPEETHRTVSVPIRARTYDCSEGTEVDTFINVTVYCQDQTFESVWIHYAGGYANSGIDNDSRYLGYIDVSYPKTFANLNEAGAYYTITFNNVITTFNSNCCARTYYNGAYRTHYGEYTFTNGTIVSRAYIDSDFEFNTDRFIEIGFYHNGENNSPILDGITEWQIN